MAIVRFHLDESNPKDAKLLEWLDEMGRRKAKVLRAGFGFLMENYPVCDSGNLDHVVYMIENRIFPYVSGANLSATASPPPTRSLKPKRTRKTTKKSKPQERSPTAMPENRPQLIVPSPVPETEKAKEIETTEVTAPNIPEPAMTEGADHEYELELFKRTQFSGDGSWDDDF